jgi:hypothetical protein
LLEVGYNDRQYICMSFIKNINQMLIGFKIDNI